MENAIQNTFNKIVDEKLSCDDGAGEWIKDFQKSKDPKFKGKSKEKRKDMALGAYYGQCDEDVDQGPLYVEYAGEMTGEKPFDMGDGEKYEYCWAIYPDGRKDIAVYRYRGDVCVAYDVFKRWYNIK